MVTQMVRRLLLLTVLLGTGAVAVRALEGPLSSGMPFPDIPGKTLAGSDIAVSAKYGQAKVFVMTFTKDASKAAQAWLDACRAYESAKGTSPGVACWDVRMVEGMPRLVRGFVEGRMRKDVAVADRERVVLVYKNNEAWRDRLMVMKDFENDPFLVLVDRSGSVQSLLRGSFDAVALKSEQQKLAAQ